MNSIPERYTVVFSYFFTRTSRVWSEAECSDSKVLKTFFNIIVNIECTFVIFHSHKPTGRQEINLVIHKNDN